MLTCNITHPRMAARPQPELHFAGELYTSSNYPPTWVPPFNSHLTYDSGGQEYAVDQIINLRKIIEDPNFADDGLTVQVIEERPKFWTGRRKISAVISVPSGSLQASLSGPGTVYVRAKSLSELIAGITAVVTKYRSGDETWKTPGNPFTTPDVTVSDR